MSEINAFEFNLQQRKAISKCALVPEFLANMPGVGQQTIDQLLAWGILEVAGEHRHGQPTFKLTKYGDEVHEVLYKANRLP